jgi:hypothetical protein
MQPDQAVWLADFVRSHSVNGRGFESIPSKDWINEGFMYLSGSIGYDIFLRANGEVWSYEDDENDLEGSPVWHQLKDNERTLAFVIAARRYPELSRLLPEKPEASHLCELCNGTGWHILTGCIKCGGLGWIPDDVV